MRLTACVLAGLVWASLALAVEREPRVGYVYPAGARQGTTLDVVLGGANLHEAAAAYVTGTGVSAVVLKEDRQVTPLEQKELREKLGALQDKRALGIQLTPEEVRQAEQIRQRLTAYGRRLSNPSLGEFITLRVTVAAAAPLGRRELRLLTRAGLTNPRPFAIGALAEHSRPDWRNVPKERASLDAAIDPLPPPVDVTLPVVVNGQVPPGTLVRYRFAARRGQQLVATIGARELIPFLADAVPGWFQPLATLTDAHGHEVARSDAGWCSLDPVLRYHVPDDGPLVLGLRDSLYRGREDFVYRVTIGELPYVSGVFPAGGRAGTRVPVVLSGSNLPAGPVDLDLTARAPGRFDHQLGPLANVVPLMADTLPECLAARNHSRDDAQSVSLPTVVNGRLAEPGQWDWYRFDGRAGEAVVAEVQARRLGSPLDSVLRLFDPSGRPLAFNDDQADLASALNTHHADSYLSLTLPADGTYRLAIGDIQQAGGPEYTYRLRLSAPRPDYALRVTPSGLSIPGGASVPVTAYALRQDGFGGAIRLALRNAPAGFRLTGATIPAGADRWRFTLSAPAAALEAPLQLQMEGRATIDGREVVRAAVPADDMTQAFTYHHLVPAQELRAAVIGRFRPGAETRLLTATPLRLTPGRSALIVAQVPVGPAVTRLDFELSEPPAGFTLKTVSATEVLLQVAATVPPGLCGNLIITVSATRRQTPDGQPIPADRQVAPLGALPAVPFEVVR